MMHRETGLITNLRSAYRDMFSFFGLKSTENESDEGQYSLLPLYYFILTDLHGGCHAVVVHLVHFSFFR